MVRDNLLADMKSAILGETKPLDLNFVYGKAEGSKFIPIDGQQRLTTLFLLHLYAFYNDSSKTKLLRNFSYETRTSSRDFLEKLTENRAAVFSSKLIPSREIEDSEWFVLSWKYDPTIQSVFIMLDKIKETFEDVENLDQLLTDQESEPIAFKFLDIDDLGMEDSLYIKLNERGKPLTPFENFKARLIGRLQKLQSTLTDDFEQNFDREWTDLFWSKSWKNFDQTYLAFFSGLLMNAGFFENEANWSNTLDYDKIGEEVFGTAFYTLNFLCQNPDNNEVHQLVFNALKEKRTYQDRVLFHAVTTYLFHAKGIDTGSLRKWLRIIQNLTLNSQIDQPVLYRRAINGINSLSENWNDLIEYFSRNGNVTGFSQEQIEEERLKAQLILQSVDFAEEIYKAEQHPYFSGQVRSALWYSKNGVGKYDKDSFVRYWDKISSLFERGKPKHGHLLRQALLTYGDFTISVGEYKTLCVDDPNEAASTPSLKRLFSNHGNVVKCLLDELDTISDIRSQLEDIVNKATLPKIDWRYCFVKFPELFKWMSVSHLRLRKVGDELLIIPNKSSNGYNYEVFSTALHYALKQQGIRSDLESELGTWAIRYLRSMEHKVKFKNGKFIVIDAKDIVVLKTKTDDPIAEATHHLLKL
ncbi:hypothetical protein PSTEL_04240 [Paenibacillus stellifer]|uniref:GmrSD restriction endonucleases N-terminal domain-containing protein n=1 Tax=Paenibacillus stellifer TaxID=169760 RepID=A0A089LTB3_9BACL|nr:hypothetical protein PSTEL_04240 [Paenibacillus stellifer]